MSPPGKPGSRARRGSRSVAAAKERRVGGGGVSSVGRPGLSVSARSIFISTPNAINLRHGALLRREQASQRPTGPGRLSCSLAGGEAEGSLESAVDGRTDGQTERVKRASERVSASLS